MSSAHLEEQLAQLRLAAEQARDVRDARLENQRKVMKQAKEMEFVDIWPQPKPTLYDLMLEIRARRAEAVEAAAAAAAAEAAVAAAEAAAEAAVAAAEAAAPLLTKREQMAEQLRQRAKSAAPTPAITQVDALLPVWPEAVRGVPNCVLRSALFGMVKRGDRDRLTRQTLAVVGQTRTEIMYTGERLDQGDLDVWAQCLHIARTHNLGLRIQFGAREFLREIDRNGGGSSIEWLKRSLTRLMECTVWIKEGKRMYSGHLLEFAGWDDETERFVIEISPSAAGLYGTDSWTAVELLQRHALKGDLARWLHAFYATHTHPFAYKVETLHGLCGSERGRLRDFRGDLRGACAVVAEATGWVMVIDADDLLQVKKTGRKVRHNRRATAA